MLSVTKLNVAGIASIILLIAYSALSSAVTIVVGGSPLEVCSNVVAPLFLADVAIIVFLHKLGLRH